MSGRVNTKSRRIYHNQFPFLSSLVSSSIILDSKQCVILAFIFSYIWLIKNICPSYLYRISSSYVCNTSLLLSLSLFPLFLRWNTIFVKCTCNPFFGHVKYLNTSTIYILFIGKVFENIYVTLYNINTKIWNNHRLQFILLKRYYPLFATLKNK